MTFVEGQSEEGAQRSGTALLERGADGPGEDAPFGRAVGDRVRAHLTPRILDRAHRQVQRKAVIVIGWYLASYAAIVLSPSVWVGILAGTSLALSMAAVGFNISHDANHNALFSPGTSRRLTRRNRTAGLALNAIGGNSTRWIAGHVMQHHAAPNVVGKDYDIEFAPFARLAPEQPRQPWYRWQHLYLWPLYSTTAIAIFVSDVTNNAQESVRGDRHGNRPGPGNWAVMIGSKAAFLIAMIGVPLLVHTPLSVLVGVLAVTGLTGILLGVVFQLAHAVDEAEFRDATDAPTSRWHEWQVQATVDFCHGNRPVARALTWYFGGLNYQIEHHLFPAVPHTAYPQIAPIVAEVCAEHGIRYHAQPTLRVAIRSHYRHLRHLGRQ